MVALCKRALFKLSQASRFAALLKFIKSELFFCSHTCSYGMCFIVEVTQRQSLSIILDKCMCVCVKIHNVLYISKIWYVSHFKNVPVRENNDID